MRFIPLFLIALSVGGCGGGDSPAPAIPGINGTWRGNLAVVVDQCFFNINPLEAVHRVAIDGNLVTVGLPDGRTLSGTATSSTQFDAQLSDGMPFPRIDSVTYSEIANGRARVEVRHSWSRPGGCTTVWAGQMALDGR